MSNRIQINCFVRIQFTGFHSSRSSRSSLLRWNKAIQHSAVQNTSEKQLTERSLCSKVRIIDFFLVFFILIYIFIYSLCITIYYFSTIFFIVVFDRDFWMKKLNCRDVQIKLNRCTLADAEYLLGKNNAFEKKIDLLLFFNFRRKKEKTQRG